MEAAVMESVEVKTYTFSELPPEVQERLVEEEKSYIANNPSDWWSDPIIEGFHEEMEAAGLSDVEVEWSGFWSQGDGASFKAKVRGYEDTKKFVRETLGLTVLDEVLENIYISINRISTRYSHANTMEGSVEIDGDEEVEKDMGTGMIITIDVTASLETIQDAVTDWARARANKLYDDLESAYNEQFEDSNVINDLIANAHQYDEEGNIL